MKWLAALSILFLAPPASAISVDTVAVGNPGNACETQTQGCFGAVAYTYQIGKYEVTNAQYAAFLNAVAATDTNGLYNTNMTGTQITRSGSPGSYTYAIVAGNGNQPITSFSFYDALRFANWLHNGQPSGAQNASTTEDGAYTFSGPTTVGARNAGARFALPTENEWYKAAYYDGVVYFDYPAGSDTATTCSVPTATANRASCNSVAGVVSVGSYTGSPSPNGTFDQGGNVWEWNETIVGTGRGVRGGAMHVPASTLAAAAQFNSNEGAEDNLVGFRVVAFPAATAEIEFVTVGNPGNVCETQSQGCFGAVAYTYQIGKYEITNLQYAAFLNAVAATDPNGVYSSGSGGHIIRSGVSGSFSYSAVAGAESQPISSTDWYDTLRFANWLHNGRPTGAQDATTTEDGAYTFSGPTTVGPRKPGAKFALATENEWYKAAYFDPLSGGYFDYPAGSNTATTCAMPTSTANRANCNNANFSNLTAEGTYTGSPSPSGTFDQGGNVWELNETTIGSNRGVRGGGANAGSATFLAAATRLDVAPAAENNFVGFRVVPEPDRVLQLVAGLGLLLPLARARRRRNLAIDLASRWRDPQDT